MPTDSGQKHIYGEVSGQMFQFLFQAASQCSNYLSLNSLKGRKNFSEKHSKHSMTLNLFLVMNYSVHPWNFGMLYLLQNLFSWISIALAIHWTENLAPSLILKLFSKFLIWCKMFNLFEETTNKSISKCCQWYRHLWIFVTSFLSPAWGLLAYLLPA